MRPRTVAAGLAGLALLFVVLNVALVATGGDDPDCSTVPPLSAAAWQAKAPLDRYDLAGDLTACKRLDGKSRAEIEAALGPAGAGTAPDGSPVLAYDLPRAPTASGAAEAPYRWTLVLDGEGRVTRTQLELPGDTIGAPIR